MSIDTSGYGVLALILDCLSSIHTAEPAGPDHRALRRGRASRAEDGLDARRARIRQPLHALRRYHSRDDQVLSCRAPLFFPLLLSNCFKSSTCAMVLKYTLQKYRCLLVLYP